MQKILPKSRLSAYVFLVIAVAIWGIATPVVKATVAYVPPITFLSIRYIISGIISLPMAIWYLRKIKIGTQRWRYILTASAIGHIIAIGLLFIGIEKTVAVEATVISSFSPLLTSILGFFLLREIITKKEIEGTLVAFIGTLLIILTPLLNGNFHLNGNKAALIGNTIYFAGVLFDSMYIIYAKKNLSGDKLVSPLMHISFSFIFAAIIFFPLGLLEQYNIYKKTTPYGTIDNNIRKCLKGNLDRATYDKNITCDTKKCTDLSDKTTICFIPQKQPSFLENTTRNLLDYIKPPSLFGIIYMALLSGIVAYTFYNIGLKTIEASEASLFYYLQPLFAIPIAIFFLNESISISFIAGAILTGIGIFLAEKR